MITNEGKTDRIIRVLLGLALLSLTVIGPQSMWGLVGLVPANHRSFWYVLRSIKCWGISTCSIK